MPAQYVPNCVSVVYHGTLFGQEVTNVWHAQPLGGGGVTLLAMETLATAAALSFLTNMNPQLSAAYQNGAVIVTDISAAGGLQVINTDNVGSQGSIAGQSNPGNVAFCLKMASDHVGRSFRGRMYVPAIALSVAAGNDVNATWRDNTVQAAVEMNNSYTTAGWQQVIVSRQLNKAVLTPPQKRVVTSITAVDLHLDSMRTRLTGRGS